MISLLVNKNFTLLLSLLILLLNRKQIRILHVNATADPIAVSISESESTVVFGYLPEYRYQNFDYGGAFELGLTHLIFFSLEIDGETGRPTALDRLPPLQDIQRARKAADQYGGKLLLSFGGSDRSRGFGAMTATKAKRQLFLGTLFKNAKYAEFLLNRPIKFCKASRLSFIQFFFLIRFPIRC